MVATTTLYGDIGPDRRIIEQGSDEDILARVAAIRSNRGLEADAASDRIWLNRIRAGQATFGDVRFRIDQKAGSTEHTARSVGGSIENLTDAADIGDASAYLEALLRQYGLESLLGWAMDMLRQGRSEHEILQLMRDPDNPGGKAFRDRFPAIFAREEAGLPPLSPGEYVQYEQEARRLMRESGLPAGFYDDPSDFTNLLAQDVSLRELSQRVELGFERVMQAPAEVRDEFARMFGAEGDQALAALFLDPDAALPALERQVAMAEMAGAGSVFGFGVGRGTAEELARFGFSFDQALTSFRQAAQLRPLSNELTFERFDVTEGDLVGGSFGIDANSIESIRKRQEGRVAPFQSGDSARLGEEGLLGAGRPV